LDEFSSSEYEHNFNGEDGDVSKGSIRGNGGGKADGNWKAHGNSDPDISEKPQHILTKGFKSPMVKQTSSPLQSFL
jgi:hypothetical protein